MNKVIKGETTVVAIIPIGLKVPKSFRETGAVKIWAPVEEENEAASIFGKILDKILLRKLFVNKIPAKAPYDKINPAF